MGAAFEARAHEHPLAGLSFACLVGPTAAGKSRLALAIADRTGAEIVSLDSMQVYRRMDVGTAKPTAAECLRVRHHMLDRVEPWERYDVSRYLVDVRAVAADLAARGVHALFVGGTGFYLKALLFGLFDGPELDLDLRRDLEERARREGSHALHRELAEIDPISASRIHANDAKRVVRALEVYRQTGRSLSEWQTQWAGESAAPIEAPILGLEVPVADLDRRIRDRTESMLAAGWREEAVAIRTAGGFGATAAQALGYRDVLEWADGRFTRDECARAIALSTRQFARRQRTWYRKFPEIRWIESSSLADDRGFDTAADRCARELGWN